MATDINRTYAALLELTARAISKERGDEDRTLSVGALSEAEWLDVYAAAVRGGVCALVWDSVLRLERSLWPPRELRLRWGVSADAIASGYEDRAAKIFELTDHFADVGIRTYCLKGLALSHCYPKPELRESGDFDCYLAATSSAGTRWPWRSARRSIRTIIAIRYCYTKD